MAKGYGETVVELIVEHLKLRAGDPLADELWPAANVVILQIMEFFSDQFGAKRKEVPIH